MRKLIRRAARLIGVSTTYHVAARYTRTDLGQAHISMTFRIYPWLHQDNYKSLVDYIRGEATETRETPCILSVTKLGV